MRKTFSIPILDEPWDNEWTFCIYSETEQDYGNENGGKPFDSFIVTENSAGSSSGYVRSMGQAEAVVESRLRNYLDMGITEAVRQLQELRKAKRQLESRGLASFENTPVKKPGTVYITNA